MPASSASARERAQELAETEEEAKQSQCGLELNRTYISGRSVPPVRVSVALLSEAVLVCAPAGLKVVNPHDASCTANHPSYTLFSRPPLNGSMRIFHFGTFHKRYCYCAMCKSSLFECCAWTPVRQDTQVPPSTVFPATSAFLSAPVYVDRLPVQPFVISLSSDTALVQTSTRPTVRSTKICLSQFLLPTRFLRPADGDGLYHLRTFP